MPVSNRDFAGPPASGNRKVMIYVPPATHRAVRQVALDEGRSASDVYGEAALAYLEARGVTVGMRPEPDTPSCPPAAAELVEAIERQGKLIEALQAAVDEVRGAAPSGKRGAAGTKPAEAMREVLRLLKAAGAAGLGSQELDAAVRAAGLRSGAAETAKAVLRGAGLVRHEGRRWYVDAD